MPQREDNRKALETGLALTLLILLAYHVFPAKSTVLVATVLLLFCMTVPKIFSPFARCWFRIGEIMGSVVSTLILTLIFLLVVTPIGAIRRLLGKDALGLGTWRSGSESLLRQRHHRWQADDLERPY